MCGAYRLTTATEAIRQLFSEDWLWSESAELYEPSARLGPSAKKPGDPANHRLVVRQIEDGTEFATIRWRFEMKWMREKGTRVPINVRSESMWTNGMFKYSARDKRCLVICSGFYEPKGPRGGKRDQYLFSFPEQPVFALGGLWARYRAEDDSFDGFCIVTTRPNDQVGRIHDRMPIILEHEYEWIDWLTGTEDDARQLCEPIERPNLSSELVR